MNHKAISWARLLSV